MTTMKRTKKKYHLFSEMSIVDEMAKAYRENPTDENLKHYKKMQDLFFKHVKANAEIK